MSNLLTKPITLDNGIRFTRANTIVKHYTTPGLSIGYQITEGYYEGKRFFVRENFNRIPSFHISSNHRWGLKTRSIPIDHQVLELCCDGKDFDFLSMFFHDFDHLNRPVLLNKGFTYKWALEHISKPPDFLPTHPMFK